MIKDHASLRHNGFWLQMCDSLLVKRVYRHPVLLTEDIVQPAKPSWSTHALQPQPCVAHHG
jgi:hypothetical protein